MSLWSSVRVGAYGGQINSVLAQIHLTVCPKKYTVVIFPASECIIGIDIVSGGVEFPHWFSIICGMRVIMMWKPTWKPLDLFLTRKTVYLKHTTFLKGLQRCVPPTWNWKTSEWILSYSHSSLLFGFEEDRWVLDNDTRSWCLHGNASNCSCYTKCSFNWLSKLTDIPWYLIYSYRSVKCLFYIFVHKNPPEAFAFIWEGQIYTFTILPLKCMDSPSLRYNLVLSGLDQFSPSTRYYTILHW